MPCSYPFGLANTQETVSIILRNYVPTYETGFEAATSLVRSPLVCGTWVMALPELTIHTTGPIAECLHSALGALALSITAYRTSKNMLHLISTQYEHSLHLLSHNLAATGNVYRNELVAAVMCLALVEVLSPTHPSSWLVHVEGVSKMIQLSSPDLFASGIEHTLFMGFRPLLILKACILRKATFFADDSWVQMPFQHHRAAPLQDLLGVAACIPGILEKVDVSIHSPEDATIHVSHGRLIELMEIAAHLEVWHGSYLKRTPTPLYWRQTVENDIESNLDLFWFQDLSTANTFTYFWAFQLICLTNIQSLLERYPHLEQLVHSATHDIKDLRDTCLELSIQIYQSMQFVLQKDFMLYGVSSAGFPLQIACKTLELDAKGRAILNSLDHTIIARSKIRDV
ncbi:hypothetical protein BKA66DRAFT_447150 [Pyrenochaeta sp. MPI-SDFR-AT-0127]|nr:hypothetical protein BKA66DRAFT_447150 [Pyrenochaeta sp. MPI-SDFR-AT-0127]